MSPLVSIDNIGLRDGIDPQSGKAVYDKISTVVAVVNGGIDASNISPTAAIPGTRLSSVSGSQIPADRIATNAVDSRVLKHDSATGAPGAAVQDGTYVKDGALNGLKLAVNTVGSDRLKIQSASFVLGSFGSVTNGATVDLGVSSTTAIPIALVISRATRVPAISASGQPVSITLARDASTGKFYASIAYPGTYSLDMTGTTLLFYYLNVASS